jgi:hypothetical protein
MTNDESFFKTSLIPQTGPATEAEIVALRTLAASVAVWANSDEVDRVLPYRNQGGVLDALLDLAKVYTPVGDNRTSTQ